MTVKKTKIIIGNLKMNGSLNFYKSFFENLKKDLKDLKSTSIGLCIPYPYLFLAENILKESNIKWGSQNIAKYESGPFTGEVSAAMLKDFLSTYIIVGHSERSTAYCESEENIADKFKIIKDHKMVPILCVGETLIEREAGIMESVVESQLNAVVEKYGANIFEDSIVAYEPIWAIGSDLAATPDQTNKMCKFIKDKINSDLDNEINNLKIIYGGSVNTKNAVQLFALDNVDGGLIGRSSLDATNFSSICTLTDASTL